MEQKVHYGFIIKTLSVLIKRKNNSLDIKQHIDRLTGAHGYVIGYLYCNRDRDIFQRDIEKELSVRRSTVTSIVALMEKNGLITRERVEGDARLKKLVLTQTAIDIHKQIEAGFDKIDEQLVKGISEEDKATFLRVAEKMKQNLERE